MDYRSLFRTLERALASIERTAEVGSQLSGIVESIVVGPGPSLGITAGRLYRRDLDRDVYVLEHAAGDAGAAHVGYEVPVSYSAVQRVIGDGFVLAQQGDPDFDPRIEGAVGVDRFAAIAIGEDGEHIIGFTIGPEVDAPRAIYLLGTLRHVINLKLLQRHMLHDLAEARQIQLSLLPSRAPEFAGMEIAARSLPAEAVGGDLYDFIPLGEKMLGVLIADSSGHGLPAALMARDVITGMRVSLDEEYRMTRAIQRVNRVVSRSALASRFISLFYAEVEANGNLIYCNAGHPPALLKRGDAITALRFGGLVLGPDPRSAYERGFEPFPPGSLLVMYTDGITEAPGEDDDMFGQERLEALMRDAAGATASEVLDRIFRAVNEYSPGPAPDDRTVVVVRRP